MPTGIGGEIGWWCPSLDDAGDGTTTITDLSGNDIPGTLTDQTAASAWIDAESNRAISLDGIGYVDVGTDASLQFAVDQAFAISIWAKMPNASGLPSLFGNCRSDNGRGYYLMWTRDNISTIGTNAFIGDMLTSTGGSGFHSKRAFSYVHSVWNHIVLMRNAANHPSGHTLWVNGANVGVLRSSGVGSSGTIPAMDYTNARFFIGRRHTISLVGMVWDDCRAFDRRLHAKEIAALATRRGYEPRGPLRVFPALLPPAASVNRGVEVPYRHRHSIDEMLQGDRVPTPTNQALTISVWFRRDTGNTSVSYEIIALEPGAWSLSYQPSSNSFRWQVIGVEQEGYYGPFEPELDMSFDAGDSLDQWTHIVVSWAATNGAGQAWVDGWFKGVVAANDEFSIRNAGPAMQIGGLSHSNPSPPEIRDLIIQPDLSTFFIGGLELIGDEYFQRFRGNPSGMAAYYRFSGDGIRKLRDSSGNDLHLEYS